jgi:hypothetical protein
MYCIKLWNKYKFVPFESHNGFDEVASASGWGVDLYVVTEHSWLLAASSYITYVIIYQTTLSYPDLTFK